MKILLEECYGKIKKVNDTSASMRELDTDSIVSKDFEPYKCPICLKISKKAVDCKKCE